MGRTHQNNKKWTDAKLAEALALCDGGMSTQQVADHYGLALSTMKNMMATVRRALHSPHRPAAPPSHTSVGDPGRDSGAALPAGHAITWGAITAGTVLAGSAYPGGRA